MAFTMQDRLQNEVANEEIYKILKQCCIYSLKVKYLFKILSDLQL